MKYELTGETQKLNGKELHRIVCVTAFASVAIGETGGLVESENPKKLIGKIGNAGYRMVVLTINNKKQYHNVHRIIAKAFIPNTKGLREVNHKDGNKLNNVVSNLEWVTTRENQIHARDYGLEAKCKINMDIANKIRADVGTHRELAKKYGLKKTEIGMIRKNKRWVA